MKSSQKKIVSGNRKTVRVSTFLSGWKSPKVNFITWHWQLHFDLLSSFQCTQGMLVSNYCKTFPFELCLIDFSWFFICSKTKMWVLPFIADTWKRVWSLCKSLDTITSVFLGWIKKVTIDVYTDEVVSEMLTERNSIIMFAIWSFVLYSRVLFKFIDDFTQFPINHKQISEVLCTACVNSICKPKIINGFFLIWILIQKENPEKSISYCIPKLW